MVSCRGKIFEIKVFRSLENAFPTLFLTFLLFFFLILSDFSWNFIVLWSVSKEIWLERNIQLYFMHFCKYLNQRKSKNRWIEWKIFQGFFKKNPKNMKRLSLITQFKIEFLLLFTTCRKVLGKMPVGWERNCNFVFKELCFERNPFTEPLLAVKIHRNISLF